jgi:hypothetical protein
MLPRAFAGISSGFPMPAARSVPFAVAAALLDSGFDATVRASEPRIAIFASRETSRETWNGWTSTS